MPFQLRAARRDDDKALGALARGLVEFHHAIDPRRFLAAGPSIERGYGGWLASEAENPEAVVVVAERDGEIVGYAYGKHEPRNWNDLLDAHGKLHDVFVARSGRRAGIARALVEELCRRLVALGCPRIVLATAVSNEPAQRLFASLGFLPTMVEMTRESALHSTGGGS